MPELAQAFAGGLAIGVALGLLGGGGPATALARSRRVRAWLAP